MKDLLIVKTGSTYPSLAAQKGDFEHWILSGLGVTGDNVSIVDVRDGCSLPRCDEISGVVVTGSHAMVTAHEAWSERTAAWLRVAVEEGVPVLGICYGHQLLAYALGGDVGHNPQGREFGTVDVHLTEHAKGDELLGAFRSPIRVHVCHIQTVLRLPEAARLLAHSEGDAHQAFVVGDSAWGLQFHPEFDAEVVRAYIERHRQELREEGRSPDCLIEESEDTPYGLEILRCFARLASPSTVGGFSP